MWRSLRIAWVVLLTFMAIIGITMLVSLFPARNFRNIGESMYPSLETGDYLTVDTIGYKIGDPKRGDIIVFWPGEETEPPYIKRVIGMPYEVMKIEMGKVLVGKSEGELAQLSEKYISGVTPGIAHVTLGEDEYFLLGDSRITSFDSRDFGPVARDRIIGKVLFRYWPISRFTLIKRPVY